MTETHDDLDARVKRADPDRWLASRFVADEAARADLLALYDFNAELARVPASVSQPLLGDIRLAWWREGLEEVYAGGPVRAHPTLNALTEAVRRRALPREALESLIDARGRDLDPAPFASEAETLAYVDRTAGALMLAATRLLDPAATAHAVRAAARAWGLAGLSRLEPKPGKGPPEPVLDGDLPARVAAELKAARREVGALSATAFPAVAYATLAGPYARAQAPGELGKRLRLVTAVATGRV